MHRTILTIVVGTLLIASVATADRRSEPLSSHAEISSGDAHRLLFKAGGFRTLANVAVSRARIEFEVTGASADRSLYLSLCPVTTSWQAGTVGWDQGWNRPGGDFDEDLAAEVAVDLSRDGRKAVFDVTPIVKEWLEQGVDFDGFILTVQERAGGEGIHGEDVSRFENLANASLVVDYRKVSPGPRGRRNRG